ncbi:P-loop containing nucleoside triphosphate hydrolase protein [Basidiobolus meristosporus CBS 931.73]|uniref:RNA helicase n=1 Tax=Basidiobolus meristosporus CBS 931.73 TaxID=1314790 RepID=A0A1Y1YJQ1_9FUNG|nr:P-loop containing nucleoside triphosphate hydrolase protein [Basidiobolus meristosporus CBS 931.73]|eukprot:ORX97986.1 P-loop containing nucleoside triphosphate hydrolase protein [Basidiobolus meristosporus CBS 931.73]
MAKKKSKLKPVNRGYATTSVAKAVKEEETEVKPVAAEIVPSTPPKAEPTNQSQTPLVEDKQNKVDNEINLLAKKLADLSKFKVDTFVKARVLEKSKILSPPILQLSSEIEHEAVKAIKESTEKNAWEQLTSSRNGVQSKEEVLSNLNFIYLTLLELGFKEEVVQEGMKKSRATELSKVMDWLCLHLKFEDLPFKFRDKAHFEEDFKVSVVATATSEHKKETRVAPSEDTLRNSWEDSSPEDEPEGEDSVHVTDVKPASSKVDSDLKSRILNAAYIDSSEDEEEDIHQRYANLKVELLNQQQLLAKAKKARDRQEEAAINQTIRKLKDNMDELQSDYFFDEKKAQQAFSIAQQKMWDEMKEKVKAAPPKIHEKAESNVEEDEENDEMFDLFDDNGDEEPSSSPEVSGATSSVTTLDVGYTNWSGKSPKDLLTEMCRKEDKRSQITFHRIKNAPNGNQAGVDIKYHNGTSRKFQMTDVSCTTFKGAENYVATCALYQLSELPLYRVLPPPFKKIWAEWDEKKEAESKNLNEEVNRTRLEFLQDLADEILAIPSAPLPQHLIPSRSRKTTSRDSAYGEKARSAKHLQTNYESRISKKSYQNVLETRKLLPVHAYRREILELIEKNQVVIISGDTGCGKSTQVPQFIIEDLVASGRGDRCKVFCTQPRRISAISIAQRVSYELGDGKSSLGTKDGYVGYQIRLGSKVSEANLLVFCTTGILLRRLESDRNLDGVSHIVIDEVQERTLEADFLLIVLKKLLSVRPDLKVILMSATMNTPRFSQYFNNCPVIEVPGRTFPVEVKFLEDAIEETAYMLEEESEYARRIQKIRHDEGTITVAGKHGSQQTIRLQWEEEFGDTVENEDLDEEEGATYSATTKSVLRRMDPYKINYELILLLLSRICFESEPTEVPNGAILIFLPGMPEIRKLYDQLMADHRFSDSSKFIIWPLHSTISSENQQAVFDVPSQGIRKIVISTNIAETGITIPDVTIVIDTGKVKAIKFDEKRRITSLQEEFVAKANARQRRGRAGRVQEGLCYHLFTKNRFESKMSDYQAPEIMRLPLEELCLRVKIYEFGDIVEFLQMAIDPPSKVAILNAVSVLEEVGALLPESNELTTLGIHLSHLPVSVHIGKMMLYGAIFKCLDPILTIAASLSFKSPFNRPFDKAAEADAARESFKSDDSDFMTVYNAYCAWKNAFTNKPGTIISFCNKYFLNHQTLCMIEEMKNQFLRLLVSIGFVQLDESHTQSLARSGYSKRIELCQVPASLNVYSGYVSVITAVITAGLYPNIVRYHTDTRQYTTGPNEDSVFIHPSSINYRPRGSEPVYSSNWFVYHTLMKSSKVFVWETSAVDQYAVVLFGDKLDIKHDIQLLSVSSWIHFKCFARTAVIFKWIQHQLDLILARRIYEPNAALSEEQEWWLRLLIKILVSKEATKKS